MMDFGKRALVVGSWLAPGILSLLFVLACYLPVYAQTAGSSAPVSADAPVVKDVRFRSKSLGREMPYRIYLPHDYAEGQRRYPVLYLLHGLYGHFQDWDKLSHVSAYAAGLEWIIVMPEADDSWYSNSVSVAQDKFEDYIAKDLIEEIDSQYRTRASRDSRAVAGLSMGGYAAMKMALRSPEMFFFAGSLSGALDAARDLDVRLPEFAARLRQVFGDAGNPARQQNDIFALLAKSKSGLPYLYLTCGEEDRFLIVNRQFVADLSKAHVRYEYRENPGGHDWIYWDREIRPLIEVMLKKVSETDRKK